MGNSLVQNCSASEESNLQTLEAILTLCLNYVKERESSASIETMRFGLRPYMDGLCDMFGKESLQIYGKVLNGTEIVSNDPTIEAMVGYDVASTNYYRGAKEANGEVFTSPMYIDIVTKQPVITMAKMIPETGSWLALDIHFSNFHFITGKLNLPQNSSYYLCDSDGTLLYFLTKYQGSYDSQAEFAKGLFQQIQERDNSAAVTYISPNDGVKRSVYHHKLYNGWVAILTIA